MLLILQNPRNVQTLEAAVNTEDRGKRVGPKTEGLFESLYQKQSLPHLYTEIRPTTSDHRHSSTLHVPIVKLESHSLEKSNRRASIQKDLLPNTRKSRNILKKKVGVLWAKLKSQLPSISK